MANAIYTAAKKALLDGDIDLLVNDIKAVLVDTNDYTHNIATNDFLDDISAGVVATSANLANKTSTGGVFDADDVVFSTVTGDVCEAVVLYVDTGVASTSRLIAFFDTGVGLPVTPGGGNITITWSNGANKIFSLT
jgi:hypothetical protein